MLRVVARRARELSRPLAASSPVPPCHPAWSARRLSEPGGCNSCHISPERTSRAQSPFTSVRIRLVQGVAFALPRPLLRSLLCTPSFKNCCYFGSVQAPGDLGDAVASEQGIGTGIVFPGGHEEAGLGSRGEGDLHSTRGKLYSGAAHSGKDDLSDGQWNSSPSLAGGAGFDNGNEYRSDPIRKPRRQESIAQRRAEGRMEKQESWTEAPEVTAVLVGRPNVGKSALFNRLTKRRSALVLNTPAGHVTRDHRQGEVNLAGLHFRLIDTAGMDPAAPPASVLARTAVLTTGVLQRCQLVLFLVDGRTGVQPMDVEIARWLRRAAPGVSILPLVNKCEGMGGDPRGLLEATVGEAHLLGLGEAVPVSAETGEGLSQLYSQLAALVVAKQQELAELAEQAGLSVQLRREALELPRRPARSDSPLEEESAEAIPLQIGIAGRPNVGKSTLMNALLGGERSLTGPEAGLTRDPVHERFHFQGHPVGLVDTAGWLERAQRGRDKAAGLAAMAAQRSLERTHVVALILDATRVVEAHKTLTHAELSLAHWVLQEGRALLVAVTKMDTLDGASQAALRHRLVTAVQEEIATSLPNISGIPVVFVSGTTGKGCQKLMTTATYLYKRWCERLSTALLNRWLRKVIARIPAGGSTATRVRYMTQAKARPPSFVAFTSGSTPLKEAPLRFLASSLRADFDFGGIPIRVFQRHQKKTRSKGAA